MRRFLVRFSESETSNHTPSLAGFTATTPELKFSAHTGGTHVCIPGYEPELFGKVVEAERVSVALIVPTMINMLLNHPATSGRDFSTWRLLMYGASPMP